MKRIFSFLILLVTVSGLQAQLGNAAHAGKLGIYVYNAYEPCSPSKPNGDGAVKVRIERRQQSTEVWTEVAVVTAPENLGELTARYHRNRKFQIAPEFEHPEMLPAIWEQYKKYPRWDSLGVYMNERGAALAMSYLWVDTTAAKGTSYEYQLTALDKSGRAIASKTTNATSYPNTQAFTVKYKMISAEGNPFNTQITWAANGGKRPQLFSVYRSMNILSGYEFIGNQFTISKKAKSDSVFLNLKDVSTSENQSYYYYAVAIDAYGNESEPTDTVVVKTYNTQDLYLPQYFIAKGLENGAGVELTWKIVAEQSVNGVEIFRSNKYDGDYTSVGFAAGTDTNFIDYSAKPAVISYYFMQVVDRFGHVTTRSARTPVVYEDTRVPRNVRNLTADADGKRIKLTWTTIEKDIAGYFVYRANGMDTNYVLISGFIPAKDSLTVYFDEGQVNSPYGYSYVVKQENTSHVSSGFSMPVYVQGVVLASDLPSVTQLEISSVNGFPMLFWNSLQSNASVWGYNVMRRTAADKSLVKLNALPLGSGTNFFTDSTAKPGVEYFYAIQTVAIADKEGSISAEYPFSSSLGEAPVPSFQQLIATDKVVELSWSIVSSNVKEINVYRASVGASNAQKIATLQPGTSEYTDSAVELGKGYFYYLTTTGLKGDESERSEVKFVKGLNK